MDRLLIGLLIGAGAIVLLDARETLANHRDAIEDLQERLEPIERTMIVDVEEN